jgi:hypothetical protein
MAYSKEEKEKDQVILLATLNYLIENHSIGMVFDDYSRSNQWYLEDLAQTELDIQYSRSQQIKRRLDMYISFLKSRFDLGFNNYIKENTPYEIDIFEDYKTDVIPVLKKPKIDYNDVYLIEKYLKAYSGAFEEQQNVTLLNKLLADHEAHIAEIFEGEDVVTEKYHYITQGDKSWTVKDEEYDQLFREINKDWLLEIETAPNGIYKLQVQFSGKGEEAITYVVLLLENNSGTIYWAKGEKLPIKAYWKDSHTVVIETKSAYEYREKYQQVRSYDEVVKIEYIED